MTSYQLLVISYQWKKREDSRDRRGGGLQPPGVFRTNAAMDTR